MLTQNKNKLIVILEAFILVIVLQIIAESAAWHILYFFPKTRFNENMTDMTMMAILTAVVICCAIINNQSLSFLPHKNFKHYIIATCIALALFMAAPSNFTQGLASVMLIVYGSIVTPVYEELLFRGYIWNRFSNVFNSLHTYIWNVALYTFWHFLYILPNMIWGSWDAWQLLKITAGLCYGSVLGYIRIKTKNCWATILAHGILNFFMI